MDKNKQGGRGPSGYCVCANCGTRIPHRSGTPCLEERCPKCGKALLREGGEHHRAALERKKT